MYNTCSIDYCKHQKFSTIKNCNYCKNHSILLFNKYCIIIQKFYNGYKCRKKLKILFYNLPCDIQKRIIFFININIYNERYNKSLRNIIRNKSNRVIDNQEGNKKNIKDIIDIYYLNNKYRQILYLNDLKFLYVYSEDIVNYLHNYIVHYLEGEYIFLLDFIDINMDLSDIPFKTIVETLNTIKKFRNNYNNEFNIIKYSL